MTNLIKRRQAEIGGALLALGGALFAIGVSEEPISKLGYILSSGVYLASLVIGIALLLPGTLLVALSLIPVLPPVVTFRRRNVSYESVPVSYSELKHIHDFAARFFGESDVSELRKMQQWHKVNPNMFWKVIEIKKNSNKEIRTMVGYYCAIPLNKVATQLVEQEELNGISFTSKHIIKTINGRRRSKPSSIYIGGIAAKEGDRFARAATVKHLREYIEKERREGIRVFYSRPTTVEGLRLIEQNGFYPVANLPQNELRRIYKLVYSNSSP